MKTVLRMWAGLAVLCMLVSGIIPHCFAMELSTDYFVTAHSNLYQDAFPVHLYEVNGKDLYIDGDTLAGLSGYTREGEDSFSLGSRTIRPPRSKKISGTRCFPLDKTLEYFGVRVWEKNGDLNFMSGRDALMPLFTAMGETQRFRSLLDPDDTMNTLGVALSYAKDFMLSWNFRSFAERYRNAIYKLIQEDMDETTFSSLAGKWEKGINKPVSTTFSFLESFMDENEIDTFYAGSELGALKEYMDGIKLEEKVLGMKISEYMRRLEEIALYFDTNIYALRAMAYVADAEPYNDGDKDIIKTAREINRSMAMQAEGWGMRLIGQLAREHVTALFYSTTANLLKEMMLGKKNLAVTVLKLVLDHIPAISFMSSLEEAYTFAEIQQFFESEMISAEVDQDWLKYKYMAIMYFRCFHASCEALRDADMEDAVPNWEEQVDAFQEACMDQIAALAGVPDSALEPFLACGDPVRAANLRFREGPEPDYSQLAPFRSDASETAGNQYPDAVLNGAREAWETVCDRYGRVAIANYGGELYLDEGDGAALPLLSAAGEDYYLDILFQQGDTLAQMIFRMDESGTYQQVFYDVTLTLDQRQALFLYTCSGTALISAASLEDDAAAFAAAVPHTVEKRFFQGNESADSIADMGAVPWEAVQALYGDPEWTVRVDANYGLFHIEIRDPGLIQDAFGIVIP